MHTYEYIYVHQDELTACHSHKTPQWVEAVSGLEDAELLLLFCLGPLVQRASGRQVLGEGVGEIVGGRKPRDFTFSSGRSIYGLLELDNIIQHIASSWMCLSCECVLQVRCSHLQPFPLVHHPHALSWGSPHPHSHSLLGT